MNHYLKRLLSFLSPLRPRAEQLIKVSDFLMSTGDGHLNMFKDLSLVRSCCKYITAPTTGFSLLVSILHFFTEFRNEEALISTGESGEAATASDTSVISVLSMPG